MQQALERVRAGADVMPRRQLERMLVGELGEAWEAPLTSFEWQPCAAASIGQVHAGVLHDGRKVAIKVRACERAWGDARLGRKSHSTWAVPSPASITVRRSQHHGGDLIASRAAVALALSDA